MKYKNIFMSMRRSTFLEEHDEYLKELWSTHSGMRPSHGWGNGYVYLPTDHPWFGKDYDDIPVIIHGGLTYAEQENDRWVIGFDTNHYGDTSDIWTVQAVEEETMNLLTQAVEAYENFKQ